MKVEWTNDSLERLDYIEDFYLDKDPSYARRIVGNIFAHVEESLPFNPEIGHMVPPEYEPNIREILYDNFRIIYEIHQADQLIEILEVRHFKEKS